MLQTRLVQPRRSLARATALSVLTILSLTTCKLDKLFGPTTPPATKLVFQVQPPGAVANQAFASAVKVYVSDALGDTVADATNSITIGITPSTGTAGAILGGSTTVSAIAGVATFNNITVDRAGTGYTLTANALPLTAAVSSAFTVLVPPTILLTPSSRTFTATAGGASPAAQTVAVTNSGSGTLSGLAIGVITYGTGGAGWLTASITPATAPSTVTLTATTGSLAAGTYTATVPVTSSLIGVANSPQTIAVTFTVSAPPAIALNPNSRAFVATVGSNPAAQTVAVTNSGGGTISNLAIGTIIYGGTPGWLAAALDVTTAPATVTLTPTTASLPTGSYTATVPVTATGVTNSPQNISVTLTVSAASGPTIVLTPSSRTFNAAPGGGNPGSQTVAVTNGGTSTLLGLAIGTITYSAGATGWATGALNTTTAPATVTLAVTTGALAAGTYTATVPVTAPGVGNSPQNISVTFTIATPTSPLISLAPTNLSFSVALGASPAAQTVSVTNSGINSLTGLSVGTPSYGAGASGWLAASINSTTAPATVTLTPTTTTLAAGTYTATVPVLASSASNSPQTIGVTLTVTQAPTITLTPTSRTFTAAAFTSNPATQTVAISNTGTGTLNGLGIGTVTYGAGATGWLAATLDNPTAPATVTLAPTTGALAAGTYTATVPVTSAASGVTNSPQNISVTFTVTAGTSNTWATLTPMSFARFGPAAEAISGVMYVAGGNGGSGDTPNLQAYDVGAGTWQSLTSMSAGRYQGDGAGVIANEMYVPGGWTTNTLLPNNNLFIYTQSTNLWRSGAAMPTLSGCGGTGVITGKLYVTTACDGNGGYRSFFHSYDPTTNAWTALASTAVPHSGPATGVISGKLYVAGGSNGTTYGATLEVFNPVAGTWATGPSMTVAREGAVGAVVNGKLYVIGGTNAAGTALTTVEVYDPTLNTWTTLAPMPTARFYAAASVINGLIYVAGGNSGSTTLNTFQVYRP